MNGLIIPEIIQQDVTIEVNNIDRQKAEGLISAIKKGFESSAFALSMFEVEFQEAATIGNEHNKRYKALWHQRADKSSALRNEYCQRNNVFTESDLPQDQARELAKSIKRSEYDLGLLPSFFYHIRFAFYASPYILGIDQIVLSLNKLKDIPSAIRDKHKYNSLLESLKEVTKGAKEHRDSISHLEERLQGRSRQEGKIKPLPDNPESLGMIKGNAPKTVQFINFWQGRNLIYTSATGEQVRFEVSIDKFILVESLVQQMFDCLNYPEFKRSRSMF